jgi:hypothetical protein
VVTQLVADADAVPSRLTVADDRECAVHHSTFLRELPRMYRAPEEALPTPIPPFFRMGTGSAVTATEIRS